MKKIIIPILVLLFLPQIIMAATFSIDLEKSNLDIGDRTYAHLSFDTDKESVNALDGKISIPKGLHLESVIDNGSIVSLWVVKPHEEDGNLVFSGIIPNGYSGGNVHLFDFLLKAEQKGSYALKSDVVALLNDGKGTNAKVIVKSSKIAVSPKTGGETYGDSGFGNDKEAPEVFSINISKDQNILDGKTFIVFSAIDKSSGVKFYSFNKAKPRFFVFEPATPNSSWQEVSSPLTLNDEDLKDFIFVKAVDNNGNERISILAPQKGIYTYRERIVWSIIIVFVLGVIFFVVRGRRS